MAVHKTCIDCRGYNPTTLPDGTIASGGECRKTKLISTMPVYPNKAWHQSKRWVKKGHEYYMTTYSNNETCPAFEQRSLDEYERICGLCSCWKKNAIKSRKCSGTCSKFKIIKAKRSLPLLKRCWEREI